VIETGPGHGRACVVPVAHHARITPASGPHQARPPPDPFGFGSLAMRALRKKTICFSMM